MKESSRAVAIFVLLAVSAGLVIGLTYVPCYATLCPEDYFPLETRLHLATYYALLAITACVLLVRASSEAVRSLSGLHISPELPILGKHITLGGLAISIWIVVVTLATAGFWLPAHLDFWGERIDPLDWTSAKIRLIVTGVIGYYADIFLGLVIISVLRNSLMSRVFELHQSILLYAYKLVAYLFLMATLAYRAAYAAYALDPKSKGSEAKDEAFSTGNPAMTLAESEKWSFWYPNTIYTGAATVVAIIMITLTALPLVRRRFYNVFYYSYVMTAISIFIGVCAHASTNFYLLLPGLFLWVVNWGMRVFGGETKGLHKKLVATGEDAGSGWYRISLPAMSRDFCDNLSDSTSIEKAVPLGYPLTCYYLNILVISKVQNHAFTAAIPGSAGSGPGFLFQRTQSRSEKALEKEWTWKLADKLASSGRETGLEVRVEGPYRPSDTRFKTASHIVCVVGGTGITGALSLAFWWLKARAMELDTRFTLIWTIRNPEMAYVKEWYELEDISTCQFGKWKARPIGPHSAVSWAQSTGRWLPTTEAGRSAGMKLWVYSSGPDSLIRATENACVKARREMKALAKGSDSGPAQKLDWYMAKWEV